MLVTGGQQSTPRRWWIDAPFEDGPAVGSSKEPLLFTNGEINKTFHSKKVRGQTLRHLET